MSASTRHRDPDKRYAVTFGKGACVTPRGIESYLVANGWKPLFLHRGVPHPAPKHDQKSDDGSGWPSDLPYLYAQGNKPNWTTVPSPRDRLESLSDIISYIAKFEERHPREVFHDIVKKRKL